MDKVIPFIFCTNHFRVTASVILLVVVENYDNDTGNYVGVNKQQIGDSKLRIVYYRLKDCTNSIFTWVKQNYMKVNMKDYFLGTTHQTTSVMEKYNINTSKG